MRAILNDNDTEIKKYVLFDSQNKSYYYYYNCKFVSKYFVNDKVKGRPKLASKALQKYKII